MKFTVHKDRKELTVAQQCVIRPDQLHCLAPNTAGLAERIEKLLRDFGIPAVVNRNNGLISVERGKLTVFPTTNATHYNWEYTFHVDELKSRPIKVRPEAEYTEADRFWEMAEAVAADSVDLMKPRER